MNKKMLYKIIPVMFVLCIAVTNIYGFGNGFNQDVIPGGLPVTEIKTPVQRIWNTVSLILQVCAVGGIVFTGVRYMFASADVKGDMKQSMPYLIIGMVIVFAAPYVINFIVDIVEDITS